MHLPALDLDLDSQWTLCWISSHFGSSLGTDDISYTPFLLTISLIFQDQRFIQEDRLNGNPTKDNICKYVGKRKRWRNTCNESLDTSVTYWAMKKKMIFVLTPFPNTFLCTCLTLIDVEHLWTAVHTGLCVSKYHEVYYVLTSCTV